MGAVIKARGLGKDYGLRHALSEVSFELPEGACLGVLGPNGAGKSTLLALLTTLSRPSAGQLEVLGVDGLEHPEQVRAQVGLVGHQSMLYGELTALQNLRFVGELYGVADPGARAEELLALAGLTARKHDRVSGFSRGMQQRLALARAWVADPALLCLDEPYTGLDAQGQALLDSLLERSRGLRTVVLVSHDETQARRFATHLLRLEQGRMRAFEELAR
jgi:heme exporter protein A